MLRLRRFLAAGALLALAACATTPPEVPPPAERAIAPAPPTIPEPRVSWSDLPGWAAEDHLAALVAVRAACKVRPPRYPDACRDLADRPPADDAEARRFFERWFVLEAEPDDGLLTAYFTPVYDARRAPEPPFTAPLRAAGDPSLADLDRAAIAAAPAQDALAWLKPEDLFFLQVQGSGVLRMDDGTQLKAIYAGSNGKGFVAIGKVMRDQGLLPDGQTSAGAIAGWLAGHRGPEADAVMDQDPRYIFFRVAPADGAPPQGAAGLPLPAGRAAAVDPAFHPMGELMFLDAADPRLSGARPAWRRIVAALDIGSAIKGPARADLYLGQGPDAGLQAGLVRHRLILYRLAPR